MADLAHIPIGAVITYYGVKLLEDAEKRPNVARLAILRAGHCASNSLTNGYQMVERHNITSSLAGGEGSRVRRCWFEASSRLDVVVIGHRHPRTGYQTPFSSVCRVISVHPYLQLSGVRHTQLVDKTDASRLHMRRSDIRPQVTPLIYVH